MNFLVMIGAPGWIMMHFRCLNKEGIINKYLNLKMVELSIMFILLLLTLRCVISTTFIYSLKEMTQVIYYLGLRTLSGILSRMEKQLL